MTSIDELIRRGKTQAKKVLDDECFFENFTRFSKEAYTPANISKVLDIIVNGFGGAYTLQQSFDTFVETNRQKEDIIAYEVANNTIKEINGLATIKLDTSSFEEPETSTPELWIKEFVKEYKTLVDDSLINTQQQAINYVAEHFNSVKNAKENTLPNYSFKKKIFRNQQTTSIDLGSGEKTENMATYVPKYDFSDVVGLEKQKEQINIMLFNPIREPERWEKIKKQPEKIIDRYQFLFYGPPGTGKTYFAKAIGGELKIPFFLLNGADFIQPLLGEGKNKLVSTYQEAAQYQNSIIFIDEADVILGKRGEKENKYKTDVVNSLLTILDGDERYSNVVSILGTNRDEDLDNAGMSRIPKENRLYFGPLGKEMKKEILQHHIGLYNHDKFSDKQLQDIVEEMNPKNFRSVRDIASSAAKYALNKKKNSIEQEDLIQAIQFYQLVDEQ